MSTITHARLLEVLRYDPVTGVFTWLVSTSNRVKVGQQAGTRDADGYIKVDGKLYKAHRLAWFYQRGYWPIEVDHENFKTDDNVWTNLREATRSLNCCNRRIPTNNATGFKGVTFSKQKGRFQAYIKRDGRRTFLGSFDTAEDAAVAYDRAAAAVHGRFMQPSTVGKTA